MKYDNEDATAVQRGEASSALPGLTLEQYDAHIVNSGISFEVAKAYGVRGVSAVEATRLGFTREQARDGLLLPLYWGQDPTPALHQLRPWVPRIGRDGRPIKYESPAGRAPVLARFPSTIPNIDDPRIPLVLTEGVKKLLAWETKRRRLKAPDQLRLGDDTIAWPAAVSLMGVHGWIGPTDLGGTGVPLAALRELPFRGRDPETGAEYPRKVVLAFDSDAMMKPAVHDALRELRDYVRSKGAEVWVMYLPSGERGAKVGLDDFLAAGHSLQDALNCCEPKLRPPAEAASLLRFTDLLALPVLPWTVRDLLPAEGVTVLYGPFASYKSFVLLDWLACVAGGVPDWFGAAVDRHGPCVYVYSEGRGGLGQRAHALRLARRLPDETPLFVLPTVVDLTNPRAVAALIDVVRRELAGVAPVIVAIDTVSRNMPAKDANAPVDMNAFVAGCDAMRRAFDCQVVAVHHPNKAGEMRGTLDLPNSADTIVKVERVADLTARLTVEKQKDADHGPPRLLRLRPEVQSLVVAGVDAGTGPVGVDSTLKQQPEKRHLTLRALAISRDGALSFGEWKRAAEEAGVAKSTFKSAIQLLVDAELVRKSEGDGYRLTEAGTKYARAHRWGDAY